MCLTRRQVRSLECGFTKVGVEVLTLGGDGAVELNCLRLERVMGIEPTPEAWEAAVLPLNYTRSGAQSKRIIRDHCQTV
jgi:hypothetical protein